MSKKKQQQHGESRNPAYGCWKSMIGRCYLDQREEVVKNYSARGIGVCQEWRDSFLEFLSHIGPRPSKAHSIDRIDNDKGYFPGNVRWATQTQQRRNTRINVYHEIAGEKKILPVWCEEFNISQAVVRGRLKRGWSLEDALSLPVGTRTQKPRAHFLEIDGVSKTMSEWSADSGVKLATIWNRVKLGWPAKDAVFVPLVSDRKGVTPAKGSRLYNLSRAEVEIVA
jgi:hypothetical protein